MTYKEKIISHYKSHRKNFSAKLYLKALQELLKQYEMNDDGADCPLCFVEDIWCDHCPWMVLVNHSCTTKSEFRDKGQIAYQGRKAQIRRWIKAYEEALGELFKIKKENQNETKTKLTHKG